MDARSVEYEFGYQQNTLENQQAIRLLKAGREAINYRLGKTDVERNYTGFGDSSLHILADCSNA